MPHHGNQVGKAFCSADVSTATQQFETTDTHVNAQDALTSWAEDGDLTILTDRRDPASFAVTDRASVLVRWGWTQTSPEELQTLIRVKKESRHI